MEYGHDAMGRRIVEDDQTEVTDLYYSASWQVLEEYVDDDVNARYVWSTVYIDAMVLRDWDSDSDADLDLRTYVQQDANYNVTALISDAGAVLERFIYDPFGAVALLTPSWGSRGTSSYAWIYQHQGLRRDGVSATDDNRYRIYLFQIGRFGQFDPSGFEADDPNLYRYEGNQPLSRLDPYGLEWKMFGQTFYTPWDPKANYGMDGLRTWLNAAGVAASGTAAGAGTGALTGGLTGGIVGSVAPGPGTLAGAGAGALAGGFSGGVSGFISAIFADCAADAAKSGAVSGLISGPLGNLSE
jgi:RHS repeat-associated protein